MTRLLTRIIAVLAPLALAFATVSSVNAQSLQSFGVLAGSTVTNTGPSVINGNVGLSPGSSITGFPPGTVVGGTQYVANGVAAQAKSDLTALYNVLAGRPTTANLTGQDLGTVSGLATPLQPGVYNFDTEAHLNGTLYLDTTDPNGVFIFKIGSALITGSGSQVVLLNGGFPDPASGGKVFFVVGSSATLDTTTAFAGQILALASITLNNAASINCGAALAQTGAVTLINNVITPCALSLITGTFTSSLGPSASANALAVAAALDAFVAGGGTLPTAFQILLATLTPDQLGAALAELAGEAGTGAAPAGMQGMNSFLSLLNSPFDEDLGPGVGPAPEGAAVKTLGYASEDLPPEGSSAFAALGNGQPNARGMSMWAAVYGGRNDTTGNLSIGSHDRFTQAFGVAAGVDYRVTPDTRIGFALAGGGTSFGLSDGLGGGNSVMMQAGTYARTNLGAAYLSGALAYALNAVTTSRFVSVANDTFSASYIAHNIAGEVEGGYRFGWLTPYAAVRAQAFFTPAYSETAASGSSTFALSYNAQTTTLVRTELGARFGHSFALHDGATLALRGRLAWAHDFASNPSVAANFQSIPGYSFVVQGATPAPDSLLVSAGAEVKLTNGFSVAGAFDGEFARNSQTYAGSGRVRYTW